MKRTSLALAASILTLITLFMVVMAPPQAAAQGDPAPTPAMPTATPQARSAESIEELIDWAQRAINASDSAANSANALLASIQTATSIISLIILVVGVALGIVAAVFGFNLNRAREELNATRLEFYRETSEFQRLREKFATDINAKFSEVTELKQKIAQQIDEEIKADNEARKARADSAIRAVTLLQLGKQQMDAKNFDAALDTLLEAANLDPENRGINYFLGELYIHLDRLDEGIARLRLAGAEDPDVSKGGVTMAKAAFAYALRRKGDLAPEKSVERRNYYYQAEGYFRAALDHTEKLLDIDGESFYGALGGLYQEQGRIEEAIECYEKANEATQNDSSYPLNNLGILYTIQGDTAKARRQFTLAANTAAQRLDDKPRDFWARFDMVTAQIMLENAEGVRKHLPMALSHPPGVVPLQKFLKGLMRLQKATQSEMLDRVIAAVEQEIARRQQQARDAAAAPA